MKKLTQGWKIFIATSVIAILGTALFSILGWPYVQDALWSKHPDVNIYVYGMDHSYSPEELKQQSTCSNINITAVKFPEGVSSISNFPGYVGYFNWSYPENVKLYEILINNRGEGIARNIKVDINFDPFLIVSLNIENKDRVKIIEGGHITGSYSVFEINELLPNELQIIEIAVNGKTIPSIDVWSENQGIIKNVYILDIFEW